MQAMHLVLPGQPRSAPCSRPPNALKYSGDTPWDGLLEVLVNRTAERMNVHEQMARDRADGSRKAQVQAADQAHAADDVIQLLFADRLSRRRSVRAGPR